jgi:cysteine dioxygenase
MKKMSEESKRPMEELCEALDAAFREDPRGGSVPSLLEAYTRDHHDWETYRHFVDGRYTRNLVRRTEDYELLVLCWGAGQESPIHNHMGQRCWMSIVEGEVEELHFRREEEGSGPLIQGPIKRFKLGQSAFINDDIALHLVRGADGQAAASLHVYSKPYDVCLVYDRETGEESAKPLKYDSVEGALLSAPEA